MSRTSNPAKSTAALAAAIIAAGAVPVTSPYLAPHVRAAVTLLGSDSFGLVMGGTANPTPDAGYFGQMLDGYLGTLFPNLSTDTSTWHALPTPEQFCPIVCLPTGSVPVPPFPLPAPLDPSDYPPNMSFGQSVSTGADILDNSIKDNIATLAAGNSIDVSGYSQSGTVASVSMHDLITHAGQPGWPTLAEMNNIHFELTGDPNNPVSGMLDRFQFPSAVGSDTMQHVPFLNIPLGLGTTPTDDFGTSTIISGEYDGWGNFPQDPVTGLLADLNAIIGIETVHPYYPDYSGVLDQSGQLASAVTVGSIGNDQFTFIPENLPILQFLYSTDSTAGQFFADALSPWLRLDFDWAYGNAGDPGNVLHGIMGQSTAGGAGVDGMTLISPDQPQDGTGAFIDGSPYEASIGVAGGPWAETPYGELWGGTDPTNAADVSAAGIAGVFEKMDPLQMIAGVQNALIQSLIGPWADVFAENSPVMSADEISAVEEITQALQFITGYDLVNGLDQLILNGLSDVGLEGITDNLLDGPLVPGQPIIDLVGLGFDVFNVFGA